MYFEKSDRLQSTGGGDFISLDAVESVPQYQLKLICNRHNGTVEEKKQ